MATSIPDEIIRVIISHKGRKIIHGIPGYK